MEKQCPFDKPVCVPSCAIFTGECCALLAIAKAMTVKPVAKKVEAPAPKTITTKK